MHTLEDTICAISTPHGVGGIAVIRVSGTQAVAIVDKLFVGRQHVAQMASHTLAFGTIVDDGTTLDEVVVSLYRAPRSYTGDDVVEISCHGSLYVQQTLLRLLVDTGARLAKPGEFTQRAFLNGKLDLTQAEAVADLIASQSRAEHDLAITQMKGGVTNQIGKLREQLLQFTALLELELDFADHEELEFADRHQLLQLVAQIKQHLKQLTESFTFGNAIKNGINVAIVGNTNVGKSTLLNALLADDRAIVSDIDGTTRDTIEETMVIDGMLFRFVDTAGIRQTNNAIENIGIERSKQAAKKAQVVIWLHDINEHVDVSAIPHEYEFLKDKTIIQVINKKDLLTETRTDTADLVYISAKKSEIEPLVERLRKLANSIPTTGVLVSNVRHYEALCQALEAIERVDSGLRDGLSGELVALDLHDCLDSLAKVTGEITSQAVLNSIFQHFCIGK